MEEESLKEGDTVFLVKYDGSNMERRKHVGLGTKGVILKVNENGKFVKVDFPTFDPTTGYYMWRFRRARCSIIEYCKGCLNRIYKDKVITCKEKHFPDWKGCKWFTKSQ